MRRLMFAAILILGTTPALAWGEVGHRTVVEIALRNLTPSALAATQTLLPDGIGGLSEDAIWADEYIEDNPLSSPWHSVNIPPQADGYDRARDCPDGQCIVEKIHEFTRVLSDSHAAPASRSVALRFLIHLVGDLHMPFHAIAPVRYPGGLWTRIGEESDTLHLWWDNDFPAFLGSDEVAAADALLSDDSLREAKTDGTPEEWANESFVIGREFFRRHSLVDAVRAGKGTPEMPVELTPDVIDEVRPIIKQRIYQGGIRLARLLNAALN